MLVLGRRPGGEGLAWLRRVDGVEVEVALAGLVPLRLLGAGYRRNDAPWRVLRGSGPVLHCGSCALLQLAPACLEVQTEPPNYLPHDHE